MPDMKKNVMVKKASGEKEPFSPEKLHRSLERSGASQDMMKRVEKSLEDHLFDGITTSEIYRKAFQLLRKLKRPAAARYSLKRAIMELGPTGYPFEHFFGALLRQMGYAVQVGQEVQGQCVKHEVDVIARNDHQQFMVECKFYNSPGKTCNVRVPLYIHSRFNDIEKRWRSAPKSKNLSFHGWVVTNTRFTTDAIDYGKCAGLRMVSWDYPGEESLKDMIEQSGLFPITALTNLTRKQKQMLLEKEIVLCRQLLQNPEALQPMGLKAKKQEAIMEEARELGLKKHQKKKQP